MTVPDPPDSDLGDAGTSARRPLSPAESAVAAFDRLMADVDEVTRGDRASARTDLDDSSHPGEASAATDPSDRPVLRATGDPGEDPTEGPGGPFAGLGRDGTSMTQLRAAVARAIDLYTDLLADAGQVLADLVDSGLRTLPLGSPTASPDGPVQVRATPGGVGGAALWVHNTTARPVRLGPLRMTDLTAADGARVPAAAASFRTGGEVAAGGSSSAWLEIAVPAATGTGVYHGHVLVRGLPEAAVGVRLLVT